MTKLKGLLCLVIFVISTFATAQISRIRATVNNDPSSSIVLIWDALNSNDSSHEVYYGKVDHGQNYKLYNLKQTPQSVNTYKGMQNTIARIGGLDPETKYFFVVKTPKSVSKRFWFRTLSNDPNKRLSIISGGDSRNYRTPRRNANTLVAKLNVDIVLFGGDMTGGDSDREWKEWFNDWQYTISSTGRVTQLISARGNHEKDNHSLEKLFDTPKGVYYAVNLGGSLMRVYTLNSESSIAGDQTTWLKRDLIENEKNIFWKLAQYHKPIRPHTRGKSENGNIYRYWAPLFYKYGVKLISESDAHTVKITYPVRPYTGKGSDEGFIRDDKNGMIFYGEGCWGAPLRSNNDDKDWTRASGKFNQFKWLFVDKTSVELRTVMVDDISKVEELSDEARFSVPGGLNIWKPSNGSGSVVKVSNRKLQAQLKTDSPKRHFKKGEEIELKVKAQDLLNKIEKVSLLENNKEIYSTSSSDFSYTHRFENEGDIFINANISTIDGVSKFSDKLNFYVGDELPLKTVKQSIINSTDDYEISRSGYKNTSSSDLEMVYDSDSKQEIVLIFRNLNLKKLSKIEQANIKFLSKTNNSEKTKLNVFYRDLAVQWSPSPWVRGTWYTTPNIKAIVEGQLSNPDWNNGDKIVIRINGEGLRRAYSFDSRAVRAAQLHLRFR